MADYFDDDDWFFDSIKMYSSLYMYDLQQPVTAMNWIDDGTRLCVAVSNDNKHEITEMSLPDKILKAEEENSGLVKDRDFRIINGGFCDNQVTTIKHIPNTRIICACPRVSSNSSGIEIWELGSEDTDLIQRMGSIKNPTPKHDTCKLAVFSEEKEAVFGSHSDNVCLADINTRQIIQQSQDSESTEIISTVHTVDKNQILCCCQKSGDVVMLDKREKFKTVNKLTNSVSREGLYWTQDLDKSKETVYQLSSCGNINMLDIRKLSNEIACFNIEQKETTQTNFLNIQLSADKKEKFSVSGFDSFVYVFNCKETKCEATLKPCFVHEGHLKNCIDQSKETRVVTHLWHPWQPDLILSAAEDGSLHGWQYIAGHCSKSG